jgi:hypothetical protein
MKSKLARILVVLLLLVGLPLAAWRMFLAHGIEKELAEIRAAGLPTNGEELNRWYPAVLDTQNAALVLTQAFALLKTINTYSDKRATEVWKLKDRFPVRADQLTTEQVALIRWHVETNLPALKKAREALKLPASRYPVDFNRLLSTELPHLAHLVNLAYLNQCEASLATLAGRNDQATTDIADILTLGRTLDNEPILISQLVRLNMFKMAVATLELRANAGVFNSNEIAILREAFTRMPATNTLTRALIGERAMTIPYFRMTRAEAAKINSLKEGDDSRKDSPAPYNGAAILKLIGYYELDYGSYLIAMNKAIALLSNSPPDNLRASRYLGRVGEASAERQRTLSSVFLSAYAGVPRRENEGIADQRLALTALAIEGFRNEIGRLPESLEKLKPKNFEKVPEDPFSGRELEYHRINAGYVIYSVGPDRVDNGGLEKADKSQSDDKRSYDITFTVER